MKTSNWQAREAARIGNEIAIETATDEAANRRARAIRAENARRVAAAQGQIAYPANSDIDVRYT